MRCEGDDCGRRFRNGDTIMVEQSRVLLVRGHRETFTVIETFLCPRCYALRRSSLSNHQHAVRSYDWNEEQR